jgi:hypothetical protein
MECSARDQRNAQSFPNPIKDLRLNFLTCSTSLVYYSSQTANYSSFVKQEEQSVDSLRKSPHTHYPNLDETDSEGLGLPQEKLG